jgi:hypothetical protein
MNKPRFVLDSNILIDTLNHKLDPEAFLDGLPDCEVYINLVTEIEVLAKPGMDAKEEVEARTLLDCFLRAEIDKPARDETIRFRRYSTVRAVCCGGPGNTLLQFWNKLKPFSCFFQLDLQFKILIITDGPGFKI